MDQEKTTSAFELAGSLLKGDFGEEQINRILLEASSNYDTGAEYLTKIIGTLAIVHEQQ